MPMQDAYCLKEIASWAQDESVVSLPAVQRGFVWRPSQIENLWDSLLRGFPVGAFVLSDGSRPGTYELLDGQQRATAISLGFKRRGFKLLCDNVRLFIDLEPPKNGDNRKYLFRVITRSHPWGYQANDNTKTLEAGNIRHALDAFQIEDHLKETSLEKFFPFDAACPIPFDFFLNATDADAVVTSAQNWSLWDTVCQHYVKKVGSKEPLDIVHKKITSVFHEVQSMLGERGCKIPALYLDLPGILAPPNGTAYPVVGGKEASEEEADEPDEIENLFVRLNAGGTPLRGEELNYSILKANMKPELQKKIEDVCDGFISPARFITIAYRLFQHSDDVGSRDTISMKIKPKQFQKSIGDKKAKDAFAKYLKSLISDTVHDGKSLIDYSRDLLLYDEKENPCGLPYLMASKLAGASPEIMFMLLYRLRKDRFPTKDVQLRKRMLGIVTLFAWFGKGEKQKDHAKLLANIWPAVLAQGQEQFWSAATVQRAMIGDALLPPTTLQALEKVKEAWRATDLWRKIEKETRASLFLKKAFFNKEMILYAQRHALARWFEEDHYRLDDTNVPFDWDHVFPRSLVHRKRHVPQVLNDCYQTNGNFRAWKYSLNRGDHDALPSKKLDPLNLAKDSDEYVRVSSFWRRHAPGQWRDRTELSHLLLNWSFCSDAWVDPKIGDIRKDYKAACQLILERNVQICKEWYRCLEIEKLLPSGPPIDITLMLNKKKWTEMPDDFGDQFDDYEDLTYLISPPYDYGKDQPRLFLAFPSGGAVGEILEEGAVTFGIVEEKSDGVLSKLSGPGHDKYFEQDENHISRQFTLLSHDEQSGIRLLKDFNQWLLNFPNKKLRLLSQHFLETLKLPYKNHCS